MTTTMLTLMLLMLMSCVLGTVSLIGLWSYRTMGWRVRLMASAFVLITVTLMVAIMQEAWVVRTWFSIGGLLVGYLMADLGLTFIIAARHLSVR